MSAEQRPGSSLQRRSAARTAVVWHALREVLDAQHPTSGERPAAVVDIGGGTGGFAVRVAELGHQVVVVDPSPDALAILARRADESGVADRVTGRQGDLASLPDLVPDGSADVVLCHGVLEIVDDPRAALRTLAAALRPGGTLSLLVNQRHAAVVTRAMAGHFGQARAMLDLADAGGATAATLRDGSSLASSGTTHRDGSSLASSGTTGRRFTADEVTALLDEAGLDAGPMHAVRVFVDLVPGSLVDLEPGAAQALVELERAVADRPEYLALATQIHTLATRR